MERNEKSEKFPLGSQMPEFQLEATDGRILGRSYFDGAKASLIVFGCNHCPYVIGSEEMLMNIVRHFQPEGLRAVMISANDAMKYPEDSFEKMKEKSQQLKLPYPYLYDETQEVAKSFDAQCTPECYLFDSSLRLVFHGTVNDHPKDSNQVRKDYLSSAIEKTLAGQTPDPQFVRPMGCSIKWKFE